MLGPIITAGIGALTFKLGMEAQKMYAKGYSTCEVARELTVGTVATCVESVKSLCPCLFGDDEEEAPRSRPKPKAKTKKPAAAPKPKPAGKKSPAGPKPAKTDKTDPSPKPENGDSSKKA
jgi:hypothetical protein